MRVTLLTQEACGFCDEAKRILERLTPEYDLQLEVLELDSPKGQALAQQGGILFAPGIFIEGHAFSYGRPSERAIRRAFEQNKAPAHAP